ncbi:MAG: diaminopimelate epimerase [Herbaspirillum sp.]
MNITHDPNSRITVTALAFTKMHACGNDFIIIDDRAGRWLGHESVLAERLCHRRMALGADGMLLLRSGQAPTEFDMVFVNADGLIGEMCGNGARCMAAFIRRVGLADNQLTLRTPAGTVTVHFIDAEHIKLDLPPPSAIRTDVIICWQDTDWTFDAIDIGVPHAVCFTSDLAALATIPVDKLGHYACHHAAFAPRGCNINFVAIVDQRLYLRTYERGVEAETLGCGTGATAAALLAHHRFGLTAPIEIMTSSGETISVNFEPATKLLQLTGGAHFVADGTVEPALLSGLELPT